jgi:hypothetical protein
MPPRQRVAIRQALKLICPAERNMLREMYNFNSIGFLSLQIVLYVVIVKTKDKSHWADKQCVASIICQNDYLHMICYLYFMIMQITKRITQGNIFSIQDR